MLKLFTITPKNTQTRLNTTEKSRLLNLALLLSVITILYNLVEGSISVFLGISDETLVLFGFGVDSFVEVLSGTGIFHMILRTKKSGNPVDRDKFERTALKITGMSFYILTIGLIIGVIFNLVEGAKPETTFWGIVIALISLVTMYLLIISKLNVGYKLNSDAIISDANCTKTCFYLSLILLASSGFYELFQLAYIDEAGSLGIAYFAFKEGKEAFTKSKSEKLACQCED